METLVNMTWIFTQMNVQPGEWKSMTERLSSNTRITRETPKSVRKGHQVRLPDDIVNRNDLTFDVCGWLWSSKSGNVSHIRCNPTSAPTKDATKYVQLMSHKWISAGRLKIQA